jgi:hypothetical protein
LLHSPHFHTDERNPCIRWRCTFISFTRDRTFSVEFSPPSITFLWSNSCSFAALSLYSFLIFCCIRCISCSCSAISAIRTLSNFILSTWLCFRH